tara:strand:- start:280 stop:1518 length:1239 start_codon:yes stop_codon:yes gene_type:complete
MADRLEKTPFTVDAITNHATIYLITNRQGKVNPIYQLDARFDNLQGNLRRYEASTKLSDKKLALKEAMSMVKKEYKHRMSYGERRLNISNDALIEQFIKDMENKVKNGGKMLSGGTWNYDNLKKNRGFVQKYIAPIMSHKPLGSLNELDLERLVDGMRDKGLSDKTITNCRTAFTYLWNYAQARGIVGATQPKFPQLQPTVYLKSGVKSGTGFASPKQVNEALGKLEKYLQKNDLTNNERHKVYMFMMYWKLLADTGIRPFIRDRDGVPCELKELDRNGKYITFARYEKKIRYVANGSKASIKYADELYDYYKEHKIKNEQLCMVGLDGKTLTRKAYEIGYEKVKKITGWDKMKDEHGRPLQSYSIRHMHITESLKRGERKIDIAKRCGTSVDQIERTYYEYMHEAREPILA